MLISENLNSVLEKSHAHDELMGNKFDGFKNTQTYFKNIIIRKSNTLYTYKHNQENS